MQYHFTSSRTAILKKTVNKCWQGHEEIGNIIKELPAPLKRKYTLNFAVTSECNLDPELMNKYFDKDYGEDDD